MSYTISDKIKNHPRMNCFKQDCERCECFDIYLELEVLNDELNFTMLSDYDQELLMKYNFLELETKS